MDNIRGVNIGDKFKNGKINIYEVVDFYEVKSMKSGEIVSYQCIAKGVNTLSTNLFETPFSTVLRNKI